MATHDLSEICVACNEPTRGSVESREHVAKDGRTALIYDLSPDRDYFICDTCYKVVHFRCSMHPESGYCDKCLELFYSQGVPRLQT